MDSSSFPLSPIDPQPPLWSGGEQRPAALRPDRSAAPCPPTPNHSSSPRRPAAHWLPPPRRPAARAPRPPARWVPSGAGASAPPHGQVPRPLERGPAGQEPAAATRGLRRAARRVRVSGAGARAGGWRWRARRQAQGSRARGQDRRPAPRRLHPGADCRPEGARCGPAAACCCATGTAAR